MTRYAAFITRRARIVVLVVLAATAFSASRIVDVHTGELRVYLDPSVDALLPTNDDGRRYYDRIRGIFGNDERLFLALHRPDGVFHADTLRALSRIATRVEELGAVHHVVSLANAPHMRSENGDVRIEPLFDEVPEDPDALAKLREAALADPMLGRAFLSPDATTTALIVYLSDVPEREFTEARTDLRIREIAREEVSASTDVWLTGGAHVKSETSRFLLRDLSLIVPLCFLVMSVVALVSFRSGRGVVVPISTIGLGLMWTFAAISDLGGALHLVTVAVPVLVLVVGFAYAVHVVSAYYEAVQEAGAESPPGSAALRSLSHVALPTLLTGLTTGAGFLSLMVSPLRAIQEFGLYCTIGVLATMVASLVWSPALLALLSEPAPRAPRQGGSRLDALLAGLAAFDVRHRRGVLVSGALLAGLALVGMSRIQISTDMVSNFSPDTEVRQSYEAVNEHLGGAGQLYVVLEAADRGTWLEPEALAEVERVQAWLEAQPGVGGTASLVDHVKLLNRGFHEDDPAYHRIPERKRLVSQLLVFGASDEIDHYVDSQRRITTILTRTTALDSSDVAALVHHIEARLAELPEGMDGQVTGNTALIARTIDDIAYSQAMSLSTAFVIIYGILAILFMSLRIGFFALLPNVLPVLVYFGALGWTGVTLNTTTGLVACLVLGIAVDDTIHFLARFNAEAKERASVEGGVVGALAHVGRPMTFTSIALCLGFSLLGLSTLKNQAEFGLLAAFTLAFAWLVDVTFTPAMASRLRVVTLWDVLGLDLGEAPQKAIPLFHGLSRTQARIAALLTDLLRFRAGHRLIRAGEKSNGMYVVVDGELRSSIEQDGRTIELNRHGRGDVLGEVGLFRGERSANVDCQTDVRVLYVEPEDMERLERRYPRIAARMLANLSRILADRLVGATRRVR